MSRTFTLTDYADREVRRLQVGDDILVGRGEASDLRLSQNMVSGLHARVKVVDDGVLIWDLGSSNGTFLNEGPVQKRSSAPTLVRPGDLVRLGVIPMRLNAVPMSIDGPEDVSEERAGPDPVTFEVRLPSGEVLELAEGERVVVGRGPHADISLDDSGVSRMHAMVEADSQGIVVRDLKSTNGTHAEDEPNISMRRFRSGETISFGPMSRVSVHEREPVYEQGNRESGTSAFQIPERIDGLLSAAEQLMQDAEDRSRTGVREAPSTPSVSKGTGSRSR